MNKQQLLTKYGKKFAPKNAARPLLEGIHYGKEGTAYITNAHYAIRIRDAHHFPETITIHATTGTPIDGVYPDVSKAFPPSFDNDNEIRISRKDLEHVITRTRCAADMATRLSKQAPTVTISVNPNGEAYLQIHNEVQRIEFSAFFDNAKKLEPSKRSLNAEYLHTALPVFSDATYTLPEQVVVKFSGPLSPIVLTDEKDIDVLILPYRVEPK